MGFQFTDSSTKMIDSMGFQFTDSSTKMIDSLSELCWLTDIESFKKNFEEIAIY